MFVRFFIDRPIFATCVALIIVVAGVVCIPILPVAQFPQIAPPTVQVSATYTGANAEVVETSVTQPLEEQINGVQGMLYMSSQSSSDGSSTINVTFDVGYDLDIAAVDVQNRVSMALPQIPEDVRRFGVTTKKQSTDFIMVISLLSPDGTYDDLFLSNFATINVVDQLKRIPGVGDVSIFGERKYSMRFWLDPDKLTSMGMTVQDVIAAIQDQNIQVASGGIGEPPSPQYQAFQYTLTTKGRLEDVTEFQNIVLRARPDGAVVRMKDVALVELGAENYRWFAELSGQSSASIGIYQLPGANAVQIANQAKETLARLAERFPAGLEYRIPYDTTMFVKQSMREVVMTLILAVILVIGVIYLFLQDWRSTLIPAITIPVSLIGTFAVMLAVGFSINTLTMFGIVLAIGLVVDDSIVVVENVSRLIETEGLSPKDATIKAMGEVTSPVIATTLVLLAVFIPVGFMPGISGQLYRQFALTIAISVCISSLNALTLSPALCALTLQPKRGKEPWFFEKFNRGFDLASHGYHRGVGLFIRKWKLILTSFVAMLGIAAWLFTHVPTGFVPDEDQGYFFMVMQGPEGASLKRTGEVSKQIEHMISSMDGVENVLTFGGHNIISGTLDSGSATIIVMLEPWDDRTDPQLSVEAIMQRAQMAARSIPDALVFAFNPPPIPGLSTTGGFQYELQDFEGGDLERFAGVAKNLIQQGAARPELAPLSTTFKVNYPQYYIDLDRTKAKSLGIAISDIFSTLQAYLGALYVNDFNKFGRIYRVFVQASDTYRSDVDDIAKLYVRGANGDLTPLSALVKVQRMQGVQTIKHYNIYRTIEINGANAPGYSSGDAIAAMTELSKRVLPDGFGFEWTGTALQEIKAAGLAPLIFGLALIFVYLFLAAQYESWSLPLIIMFSVPLALLGALAAQKMRGLINDIYCQVGLVMLIGLASKNAILIVEFAKEKREEGLSIVEASMEASRLRLRPVLMTAISFILGIVPLVVATGAGAASRQSLGTAVCGGMMAATVLSLIMVPVLFVLIRGLSEKGIQRRDIGGLWLGIKNFKERIKARKDACS